MGPRQGATNPTISNCLENKALTLVGFMFDLDALRNAATRQTGGRLMRKTARPSTKDKCLGPLVPIKPPQNHGLTHPAAQGPPHCSARPQPPPVLLKPNDDL